MKISIVKIGVFHSSSAGVLGTPVSLRYGLVEVIAYAGLLDQVCEPKHLRELPKEWVVFASATLRGLMDRTNPKVPLRDQGGWR